MKCLHKLAHKAEVTVWPQEDDKHLEREPARGEEQRRSSSANFAQTTAAPPPSMAPSRPAHPGALDTRHHVGGGAGARALPRYLIPSHSSLPPQGSIIIIAGPALGDPLHTRRGA